jgi:hypothetical protein
VSEKPPTGAVGPREGHVAWLAASRLAALRQHMKYEHTRADAVAALRAGRWRLAVLSARAAVGFAVDVQCALHGVVRRDEVRRRSRLAALLADRPDAARAVVAVLEHPVTTEAEAAPYLDRCWEAVDSWLRFGDVTIAGYHHGDTRRHEQARSAWLAVVAGAQLPLPYDATTARQLQQDAALPDAAGRG